MMYLFNTSTTRRQMKSLAKPTSYFGFIVAILTTVVSIVTILIFGKKDWIFTEAGIIENAQWILIVCAMIAFASASLDSSGKSKRMIYLFLVVLNYIFLMREIDFETLPLPDYIGMFLYGKGKNIVCTILIAIPIVGALLKFKHYFKESIDYLLSKEGITLFLGGVLLGISSLFEHQLPKITTHEIAELFEEITELWGYVVILYSSTISAKILK